MQQKLCMLLYDTDLVFSVKTRSVRLFNHLVDFDFSFHSKSDFS